MRILVSLLTALCLASFASAQWTCPYHRDLPSPRDQSKVSQNSDTSPSRQYSLQGVIGSKTVKMYLNQDGADSDGLFYTLEGDWTPVFLFGNWKPGGFEFSGESEDQKPIGRLQGKLAENVLLGQWTPAGSDRAEPVRLSVVPKIGCDGKEEWTRFNSSKWPFSFSYPASWKLVEEKEGGDSYIRLICPDPEEMIYNTDVTVSEGLGEPPARTGLVRCGMEWRFDAECSDDINNSAYSHIPTASVRHGMEILDTSSNQLWRVYCRNWGYVGLGEGTDIFALPRNGWINLTKELDASDIVGRIVDTIRPYTAK